MIIARSLSDIGDSLRPSVVTIGKFNAIHRGHVAMISQATEIAAERGLHSIVVTFDRHPAALLTPENVPADITGVNRRLELMSFTGVEACLILPFTQELADLTPEEFVQQILVD